MKDMNIRRPLTVLQKAIETITKNRSELVWKSLARSSFDEVATLHRLTCHNPYAFVGSLVSSCRVRQTSYITVHFWNKSQYNFILQGEAFRLIFKKQMSSVTVQCLGFRRFSFRFSVLLVTLHVCVFVVHLFSVFLVTSMTGSHRCFYPVWSGFDFHLFSNKLSSETSFFGLWLAVA